MIWRLLAVLRGRGEMPDPVDRHWLTAAAALQSDSLFLPPPPDCFCAGCVDARFVLIVAQLSAEEHR